MPSKTGRPVLSSIHLKDLTYFLELDPRLRRTVIVDSQLYTCLLDPNNLVPVIPYFGEPVDDQLFKLANYLKLLTSSTDVRETNRLYFGLTRSLKLSNIERIVRYFFNID